jgi:hypothetical protein
MTKWLLIILFLLMLLAIGICCLFFPRKIQSMALEATTMGPTSNSRVLRGFIGSSGYILSLRVIGTIAFIMFLSLLFSI